MTNDKKVKCIKVFFNAHHYDYYLNTMEFPINNNDDVVVESDRGEDIGKAIVNPIKDEMDKDPLKFQILRKATRKDIKQDQENRIREKMAQRFCQMKVNELGLPMNLIRVEYRMDRKKIVFYFTAENRIDFRELVKILASEYKTRIEMRQISPREELQKAGSIGSCGLPVCCNGFIENFEPISTQYVKDQNLPMNPSKISGCCGKLKCCYKFEHSMYEDYLKQYPPYGTPIKHENKKGVIEKIDIFQNTLTIRFEGEYLEDFSLNALNKEIIVLKEN